MATDGPRPPMRVNHPTHLRKEVSPVKEKRSVVVSSIFNKKRPIPPRTTGNPLKAFSNDFQEAVEGTAPKKVRIALKGNGTEPGSSTVSPRKPSSGRKGRKEDPHPLSEAFNDTTQAYRNHLYKTTLAQLEHTHNNLIMHLHDSTLYSTPDPNGPNGSPVKLQIWTMLQQSTRHLCTPIGPATLRIPITNTNGEKEKVLQSLESRMTEFETLYKSEVKELQALHAQWETVVGEIWKCGVQFLGEEKMREMLMPSTQNHTGDKEQAKELVVAGDGDQDAGAKGKKKVAFRDPLPRILTQPSAFQRSVQPLPDVPGDEVQKLEDMIDGLGAKQIEEFRKLDKEEKKWWRRKEGRIAAAFQDE